VIDALTPSQLLEYLALFGAELGGNNDGNRLPDCFLRCEPKKAGGSRVPRPDEAIQRLADDRIIGRLHDGSHQGPVDIGVLLRGIIGE
jgi:hypothetical protein